MKTVQLMAIGLLLVSSFSCKEAKKEAEKVGDEIENKETFTVVADSTTIKFTAYKTTDKKGVGGEFTTVNLKNAEAKTSALDALNGLEFSIPISSLFTNDATKTRDPKIMEFFFGVMDNTEFISGTFKFDDAKKCSIDLKLNGVTANLPMEYSVSEGRRVSFSGVMNLETWNALDAVASLNKACEALHTGKDGVSKTWNDVAIEASTYLK